MSDINIVSRLDNEIEAILPVFATKEFLSVMSADYGWFCSENFLLPYFINKKLIFRYMIFPSSTIYLRDDLNINDEKLFLNEVVCRIKNKFDYLDFIAQSPTHVVFNTYPDNSVSCEFGSYQINLMENENVLFNNIHSKHKNVIRKALKDNVKIKKGQQYKNDVFELVQNTMFRQKLKPVSKKIIKEMSKLENNIEFYMASRNNMIQGCAIIFWNKNGAYYMYGGSIENPSSGSLNLMHWEIIKDMKSKGVKLYDFVGARINPIKNSKLEGIQRFKSRFGGTMQSGYLWKYQLVLWKCKLFNFLKKINCIIKNNSYVGDIIDQESNLKTIFLTFDYELFFGEDSGTLLNSILKPTDALLDTLKECNILATFYIDTIYIEKLLENNLIDEYHSVKNQIQRMIIEGHRVELHLHPHWYEAIYLHDEQKWKFPTYQHYRIQSYSDQEIGHIFDKSVKILYEIVHEVNRNYQFHSYRAGGWCIQPFGKILPCLTKHNIFVDSSVMHNMKSQNNIHYFDFMKMPTKDIYKFENEILIENNDGKFMEFVCSAVIIGAMFKIINKILLKFADSKIYGDGKGMNLNSNSILYKLSKTNRIISIENISHHLINRMINQYKYQNIIIVSHPKLLSNESFKCIKKISRIYKTNIFKNYDKKL